jgi:hypothetical protein
MKMRSRRTTTSSNRRGRGAESGKTSGQVRRRRPRRRRQRQRRGALWTGARRVAGGCSPGSADGALASSRRLKQASEFLHGSFICFEFDSGIHAIFDRASVSSRCTLRVALSVKGRNFSSLTVFVVWIQLPLHDKGSTGGWGLAFDPQRHWQWSSPHCWSSCSARQGENQHGVVLDVGGHLN